ARRTAWRVARGAWRVARGAWRVARGAWRVARGWDAALGRGPLVTRRAAMDMVRVASRYPLSGTD
ncbi:MAG: PaaI family thioesterase, partial [Gemmatimonadetes bacterium]|nr:PaaI family thioesterase [Gemmatimonadota bacterium]